MAARSVPVPRTWRWDGERWAEVRVGEDDQGGSDDAERDEVEPPAARPEGCDRWRWDGEQWQPRTPAAR